MDSSSSPSAPSVCRRFPPEAAWLPGRRGYRRRGHRTLPYGERLAIAAANGPSNTVVAGDLQAIDEVVARFTAQNVRVQPLTVSHAFDSPLIAPMLDGFEAVAREVRYASPRITVISNLTGGLLAEDEVPDAGYWRRHIRNPVRFADGMWALGQAGAEVYLELGPNPVLVGIGRRCLPPRHRHLAHLPKVW